MHTRPFESLLRAFRYLLLPSHGQVSLSAAPRRYLDDLKRERNTRMSSRALRNLPPREKMSRGPAPRRRRRRLRVRAASSARRWTTAVRRRDDQPEFPFRKASERVRKLRSPIFSRPSARKRKVMIPPMLYVRFDRSTCRNRSRSSSALANTRCLRVFYKSACDLWTPHERDIKATKRASIRSSFQVVSLRELRYVIN